MTNCPDCPYWRPDPEARMGVCPQLVGVIEVNAGAYGLDVQEFLTPRWFGCNIPEQKEESASCNRST